jgi:hypothetical protein
MRPVPHLERIIDKIRRLRLIVRTNLPSTFRRAVPRKSQGSNAANFRGDHCQPGFNQREFSKRQILISAQFSATLELNTNHARRSFGRRAFFFAA